MGIDLSALDMDSTPVPAPAAPASTNKSASAPPASGGSPMLIPLELIDEDPNQPRKMFGEEAMGDITASIKAKGVKSPVSIRPNPEKPGRWLLNYGARRYRGSVAAGLKFIPAFVDEKHDSYDQVIENLQREDLSPMELALFIKACMADGEKPAAIARKLGKNKSVVTFHQALIDLPPVLEDVYASGRNVSPQTLYTLRTLHEKYPEAVEEWIATGIEITRTSVAALSEVLKSGKKGQGGDAPAGESVFREKHSAASGDESGMGETSGSNPSKPAGEQKGKGTGATEGAEGGRQEERDTGELTSWPKGKAVSDPDLMKKPLLLVEHDGRSAAVLLNRKPSTPGLLRIRYEDGGGDAEVDARACTINQLTEGGA